MNEALRIAICMASGAIGLAASLEAFSAPLAELLPENSFVSFSTERTKVSAYLACPKPKLNQASGNLGALYSCIGGKAETVKFFVNELPNSSGRVKNVKFLWNDYTKNTGEGIHADAGVARQWAGLLAEMYAPNQKPQILKAFVGNADKVIESPTHVLTYTYRRGPAIDERMYVVTKK